LFESKLANNNNPRVTYFNDELSPLRLEIEKWKKTKEDSDGAEVHPFEYDKVEREFIDMIARSKKLKIPPRYYFDYFSDETDNTLYGSRYSDKIVIRAVRKNIRKNIKRFGHAYAMRGVGETYIDDGIKKIKELIFDTIDANCDDGLHYCCDHNCYDYC